jgi:hypothetical protein
MGTVRQGGHGALAGGVVAAGRGDGVAAVALVVAAVEQAGQGLVQPVGIADRGIEFESQPGDLVVRQALELQVGGPAEARSIWVNRGAGCLGDQVQPPAGRRAPC